jgi:sigma-E factor negative regulatory protein RseA
MKDRISALMDGELDAREAADTIGRLGDDAAAREAWRTYHLIGDAMRESRFAARAEPRLPAWIPFPSRGRRFFLPAAAAAAAVALVAWVAFAPLQPGAPLEAPLAQAKPPATAPLSSAANDYLLAHQGFSPRVAFQGMAPYVRTVSDQGAESRK